MTNEEKLKLLKQLGKLRRENCYTGYKNIGDFYNGLYDSEFVSPYTKGSCNVASKIFIVLQDWTSSDSIEAGLGEDALVYGRSLNLPTNKNLENYLREGFNKEIGDVFTTNLFPFIKNGKMENPIASTDLRRAFVEFCYPQIEIIQPSLVVCCGSKVYSAAIHTLQNRNEKFPVNHHFFS